MFEITIQIAILFTGIAGAFLNARHRVEGFYLWILCNSLLIASSIKTAQFGITALYLTYTGLCVYGIVRWRQQGARQVI